MNINKEYAKLAAAALAGVAVGFTACRVFFEVKLREELSLQVTAIENSYEAAIALRDARDFVETISEEEVRQTVAPEQLSVNLDKPIETVEAPNYLGGANPYHDAIVVAESKVGDVLDHDINDYGVSYIEEEDFIDDDGRGKLKIDIMMDDETPLFLLDGEQVDNWEERIGGSILIDFYRLCPPGTEAILYVRNHRTDEDYEVVRVTP